MFHSKGRIFRHECTLQDHRKETGQRSPYDTGFHRFTQYWRNQTIVHRDFESQHYFRSHAAFRREKNRHLTTSRYKYIIHPFSMFARRKSVVMACVWLVVFWVEPVLGSLVSESFHGVYLPLVLNVLFGLNLVLLGNIGIHFYTGYAVETTRIIVLEKKEITQHYLRSYFFIDFLPTMCYFVFYFGHAMPLLARLFFFEMLKLRLGRIITFVESAKLVMRWFRLNKSLRIVLILCIVATFFLHTLTCLFMHVDYIRDRLYPRSNLTWRHMQEERLNSEEGYFIPTHAFVMLRMYYMHLSVVLCHFFGCWKHDFKTNDSVEMMILAWTIVAGMMFYLYTISKVLQLFGVVNISESKYEELHMQMVQFVCSKNFAKDLKKRILMYHDYKYNRKYFSEQRILDTLTEHLRMEVLLYSCRHLTEQVQIFKGLSKAAVGCVLALLKQEIYIPGDQIMASNDEDGTIYFILYGTCGVFLLSNKEMFHIEDGNNFGENRDFAKSHIYYKVVALEMAEVYRLEGKDIKYCCRNYPEITNKIDVMAKNDVRIYSSIYASREHDEDEVTGDIIDDLRKGMILVHGYKRSSTLD